MTDFLDILASEAKKTIREGYYNIEPLLSAHSISLKTVVLNSEHNPIITEIKAASPSLGLIRKKINSVQIAKAMVNGGAIALSVLTEPRHFKGSLTAFSKVRKAVSLPILMKDIIISSLQLEAASKLGANAVLFIATLFDRGYCEHDIKEMISQAHAMNLEVLLETHNKDEFQLAIDSNADLIGINNRDLKTLKIDLTKTQNILKDVDLQGQIVVSESGVRTLNDLRFLHECGAHAFLIGSSIMSARNIEKKVKEYVLGR